MISWVTVQESSDFSLQNLPYGVFSSDKDGNDPRIGVAIGDWILDLRVLAQEGVFQDLNFDVKTLESPTLNAYAALSKTVHQGVRQRLQKLLEKDSQLGHLLKDNKKVHDRAFFPQKDAQMHLPMKIGDYTDFFVGLHHAVTVRSSQIGFAKRHRTNSFHIVCRARQTRPNYRADLSLLLSPTYRLQWTSILCRRLGNAVPSP